MGKARGEEREVVEFESKGGDSNFLPFLIRAYHDKFLPANFYIYVRETILIF